VDGLYLQGGSSASGATAHAYLIDWETMIWILWLYITSLTLTFLLGVWAGWYWNHRDDEITDRLLQVWEDSSEDPRQ